MLPMNTNATPLPPRIGSQSPWGTVQSVDPLAGAPGAPLTPTNMPTHMSTPRQITGSIALTPRSSGRLEALLAAANGKATAHTVYTRSQVVDIAAEAEARLHALGIPKKLCVGCNYTYVPSGPAASSYKYHAISTRVVLVRGSSTWRLASANRIDIGPRQGAQRSLGLTPSARAAAISATLQHTTLLQR